MDIDFPDDRYWVHSGILTPRIIDMSMAPDDRYVNIRGNRSRIVVFGLVVGGMIISV